jgi:hypothetical protein
MNTVQSVGRLIFVTLSKKATLRACLPTLSLFSFLLLLKTVKTLTNNFNFLTKNLKYFHFYVTSKALFQSKHKKHL